jgi:PEP-utilizing family enzyme
MPALFVPHRHRGDHSDHAPPQTFRQQIGRARRACGRRGGQRGPGDFGGTLSHAAIVGREYGVPTVTAVGLATLLIADGDGVEVDGTSGRVTVLRRAGGRH